MLYVAFRGGCKGGRENRGADVNYAVFERVSDEDAEVAAVIASGHDWWAGEPVVDYTYTPAPTQAANALAIASKGRALPTEFFSKSKGGAVTAGFLDKVEAVRVAATEAVAAAAVVAAAAEGEAKAGAEVTPPAAAAAGEVA